MELYLSKGADYIKGILPGIPLWGVFIILRCILTLVVQPGYIHPDEFFQSTEVVAGHNLYLEYERTWEFKGDSPIRSALHTYVFYTPSYFVLQILWELGIVTHGSGVLLAPRVMMLLISLMVDRRVLKILRRHKHNFDVDSAMLAYTTSYITLIFYTRTLSNTLEAFIWIEMLDPIRAEIQRIARCFTAAPRSRLTQCSRTNEPSTLASFLWVRPKIFIAVSFSIVFGFFNRPTYLFFAYIPVMNFLFDGVMPATIETYLTAVKFAQQKLFALLLFCCPVCIVCIFVDNIYYSNWNTDMEVHLVSILEDLPGFLYKMIFKFAIKDVLVITPLNFLNYNMKSENLAEHGTHNRLTHFFVNQPLLFGTLFFCVLFDAFVLIATKIDSQRIKWTSSLDHSEIRFWLHCYLVPIIFLSLFPHQEARFLIPLLLPLVILYGHLIFGKKSKPFFKYSWIILNVTGVVFYGFLHQSGVVKSIDYMREVALKSTDNKPINVVYSHTYMPPKHLFLIRDENLTIDNNPFVQMMFDNTIFLSTKSLTLHDMKGQPLWKVEDQLSKIWNTSKDQHVYLIAPTSIEIELCLNKSMGYVYRWRHGFSGHITMEDPITMQYLSAWSDRGFPCSICPKLEPCKLHPFHILGQPFSLNIYKVLPKG